MTYLVGIWSRDNSQHTQKDNDYRLGCLYEICIRMQWHVSYQASQGVKFDHPWHSIVVLPEYYFSRIRSSPLTAKAMQEDVKDHLVDKLKQFSAIFPQILLIPGTVAFRKSLIRPVAKQQKPDGSFKSTSRLAKAVQNLQSDQHNQPFDKSYQGKALAHNPGADEQLKKIQADLGLQGEKWVESSYHIYKNQAYVLLGGLVMFKYNKKVGFFETQGASQEIQIHAPDMTRGNCVDLFGKKFCFEICFDHNKGTALATTDGEKKASQHIAEYFRQPVVDTSPDVHVVMSDAVGNVPPHVVAKQGGIFIHASSIAMLSGVNRVGSSKNDGVALLEALFFDGSPFHVFKVD